MDDGLAVAMTSNPNVLYCAAALLLLRTRVVTAPKEIILSLGKAQSTSFTPEELLQALQQLYVTEGDGSKSLLVPHKNGVRKVPIRPISSEVLEKNKAAFPPLGKDKDSIKFTQQLRAILFRVVFPQLRSKESLTLATHSFFLLMRTVLSVWVARLDGRIVRDLISADGPGFARGLLYWFLLAIPSTYTNSMIRHLQSKLSLQIRARLTRYIHDLYLSSDRRYYKTNLEGIDQYITADTQAFADSLSALYGNVLKPSLDLFLFTSQLSRSLGVRGTVLLFVNYYVTARILRAVTPAFGRLAAMEAKLEGEYRAGMSRVSKESEEIAFYDGGTREKSILSGAYMRLIKHVNRIYKIRIAYEWTEDFVIKYAWSAAGYALIAIPLLFTRRSHSPSGRGGIALRTESYISNRRLLLSLADAGGRLMYAYKDVLELAGLTTRLYTLISSLYALPPHLMPPSDGEYKLENVDIKVDDHALVWNLSLRIRPGEHLMITGSNGVGKTSVARILAGLWSPSGNGAVKAPQREEVIVVPQRAYLPPGSLLSQIIYPHSYPEFVASGKTIDDLIQILTTVHLAYLPAREGGWETIKEWRDVLSGGEKQRLGLARVFYHRPKFAVLDEATSAVSSDVEGGMYEAAKRIGVTLITISLRPSLMKYHTHLLSLSGDGAGSWTLTQLNTGTQEEWMGIDKEIAALEGELEGVSQWEERVKELTKLLSVQDLPSAPDEVVVD